VPLRPTYPIATERLALRPFHEGDIDALLAYHSSADVHRYLPMAPMDADTVRTRITEGPWSRSAIEEEGQALVLGVELSESHEVVGDVMLLWVSAKDRCGEVGYVFHPGHEGRGYATEAVRAMVRLGFEDLGLHRVIARIDARNGPSLRLARRLGMRQEAHFVESTWLNDEWADIVTFALLETEWRASAGIAAGGA
jgi:RimJ/RimL family protein N-acetyltransferase